jgi:hypothetical protein
MPSVALKKSVPLTLVRNPGLELSPMVVPGGVPVLMLATISVPPGPTGPPLLFHSSTPLTPSVARKKRVPLTLVSNWGLEVWLLPGRMSIMVAVV